MPSARQFFRMLADERGSQNAKSAVGILFFFIFVGSGALLNSSSLPLSYNIAFGDSGGGNSGSGGGGGGYSYSPKTKARIDYLRLTVHYDNGKNQTKPLGSVSNDVSVGGTGWLFPENAGIEDGNRSVAEMQFGESSYYVRALNFGFALPKTGKISGITLDIKRSAEGPDAIKDYSVRLVVGGKIVGTEYAKEEAWSAQDEFRAYGGASDAWGANLAPDDVNNGSFGVVIAARNGGSMLGSSAQPANQVAIAQQASNPTPINIAKEAPKATDIEALIKLAEKEKRGASVRLLQGALIRANRGPAAGELAIAGATGYYGTVTQRAVAEWKQSNGAQNAPAMQPAAAPAPKQEPAPSAKMPTASTDSAQAVKTPLMRDDKGEGVAMLQRLLIQWNVGPEARALAETGATGVYGPRTERAVTELQEAIVQAVKGPQAWKLAQAFFKYAKGSWGDATKAATIEYLGNLR